MGVFLTEGQSYEIRMLNRKRAEYADTSRKYVKVTSHVSPDLVGCTFGCVYWPEVQYRAARLRSVL